MNYRFRTTEQFVAALGLTFSGDNTYHPYENDIGFTVRKEYPLSCRYRPPRTSDGRATTSAIISVAYLPARIRTDKPHWVPLFLHIGLFSAYLCAHRNYDFTKAECPTKESVLASEKSPQPVELQLTSGLYFNHETNKVVDSDGSDANLLTVMDSLYTQHLKTVDTLRGRVLRWRLSFQQRVPLVAEPMTALLKQVLEILTGRTFDCKDPFKGSVIPYESSDMVLLATRTTDVFGYKANKNIIVVFCIIMLCVFFVLHLTEMTPSWLVKVSNNGYLGSAFCILVLTVLDTILPWCLLRLINLSIHLRWKIPYAPVRFGK